MCFMNSNISVRSFLRQKEVRTVFFLHTLSFLFIFYQWEGGITFEERGKKRWVFKGLEKKLCVKGVLLSLLASVWICVSYHPMDCGIRPTDG